VWDGEEEKGRDRSPGQTIEMPASRKRWLFFLTGEKGAHEKSFRDHRPFRRRAGQGLSASKKALQKRKDRI